MSENEQYGIDISRRYCSPFISTCAVSWNNGMFIEDVYGYKNCLFVL